MRHSLYRVKEALDTAVDAVIESGVVASEPTTVIDFVDGADQRVG